MRRIPPVLAMVLFVAGAAANDDPVRAQLFGEWQIQESADRQPETWKLESKDTAIHITHFQNGEKVAEFDCNTVGRECEATDSGRPVKVTLWYSGPKLVQTETRGSEVVKRRFVAVDGGEGIEIEVIPIVPDGKPALKKFKKVVARASGK